MAEELNDKQIAPDASEDLPTEETLCESEHKFRLLTETIQDVFWISTPGITKMLYVSPMYEKIWGKSTQELYRSPRTFLEAVHPDDIDHFLLIINEFHANGKAYECDYRILPMSGSLRWIHERGYPITDSTGRTVLMTGLCTDITDRKQAEEQLRVQALELQEQNKVLNCLFGFSYMMRKSEELSLEEILGDIIAFVPQAWQYPDIARAKITLNGINYSAADYKETSWRLVSDILVDNRAAGYLEVCYLHALPEAEEDPFLNGERKLIDALAERIGRIIEHKQSQDALQEREFFLKSLLEAIPIPVFYKDRKGHYLGFNNAFEAFWGATKNRIIGKTVFDIIPPDLAGNYHAKDQELYKNGSIQQYESQIQNALGDRRDVIFNKAVFHDRKGNVIGLIGTILDITERLEAEAVLLKNKEQRSSLVDNLIDSLVVTDQNGTIKFVNNAACDLFGIEKEDLVGDPFGFPIILGRIFEVTITTLNGTVRYAEAKSSTIEWDGESSYLISLRDITEKKRAMKEHEKLDKHLQQVEKIDSIGNLAGGIAHDFNNMLSVILGYGEELIETLHRTDPLRESASEIVEAAKRSAELTRQLLAFSRRQTLQPKVLDLNRIVKDIENMIRRLIGEDIELTTVTAKDLGNVKVDPGQIEQVIVNLAINARDAMPLGGKLMIKTENIELDETYAAKHIGVSPGSYVALSIADNGCGMDETVRAKVFEPFFTTKEKGKGTGLGLSTVYGIVKQSGGNIWLYSEPGQGTTFRIYLPETTEGISGAKTSEDNDAIQGNGELIIVVEDELALRRLCEKILILLNYKVKTASNGGEALLLIEEKKLCPDLLITDIVMPEMSGKVLVDRLKKNLPALKVLYMSGYTDEAIVHHGVLDSDTPFIQKPFSKHLLGKAVKSVLYES